VREKVKSAYMEMHVSFVQFYIWIIFFFLLLFFYFFFGKVWSCFFISILLEFTRGVNLIEMSYILFDIIMLLIHKKKLI
jgi:hypothetical protein